MRRLALLAALGSAAAAALWWRRNPAACPYSQRFWVEAPHPLITRPRLREVLDPRLGERLLEVGPGTGYYTLPVAGWVAPGGEVELLDVQQDMLDDTLRRAEQAGVDNLVATLADAQRMPYVLIVGNRHDRVGLPLSGDAEAAGLRPLTLDGGVCPVSRSPSLLGSSDSANRRLVDHEDTISGLDAAVGLRRSTRVGGSSVVLAKSHGRVAPLAAVRAVSGDH